MSSLLVVTILHLAVTAAMTGLIWFVQIVHYPLFARVGEQDFGRYEVAHARRTSLIVVPLMLVEAATALALVFMLTDEAAVWAGLGLLAIVWLSTALLQVPRHQRLQRGFDAEHHRRLVHSNWLRTFGWSARSALALVLLPAAI